MGTTADGYIIFWDLTLGGLFASDTAGNVSAIGPSPDAGGDLWLFWPIGNVVGFLTNYSLSGVGTPYDGTLYIWSHTHGLKLIATHSNGFLNVSADSSIVAYSDSSDPTGTVGNIGVVNADGTGAADLVTGVVINVNSTSCAPSAAFDGKFALIASCDGSVTVDGGVDAPPTIHSFNGAAGWASTLLASDSQYFSPDKAGLNVTTLDNATSALSIQGLSSTQQATLISPWGYPSGANWGYGWYLSHASAFALFTEPSGALGRATFANPDSGALAPVVTTIAAAGAVSGFGPLSPDESYDVDWVGANDPTFDLPTSLTIRSVATGAASAIVPAGTSAAVIWSFTSDSSRLLYSNAVTAVSLPDGSSNWTAGLRSVDVTGSGSVALAASGVWAVWPLGGTRVIYNANWMASTWATPNGEGTADIYTGDATVGATGSLLVAGADGVFHVTTDMKYVFYTVTQGTPMDGGFYPAATDGLFVAAIP